jgi:hypothetical protein
MTGQKRRDSLFLNRRGRRITRVVNRFKDEWMQIEIFERHFVFL